MLDLFTIRTPSNQSQLHFPEMNYISRTYQRELDNIQDYYHNRVYTVKSNHILANLLTDLNVPMQYGLEQYLSVAEAKATYVAKASQLTSEVDHGKIHHGCFYGGNVDEIIMVNTDPFDFVEAEKYWKNVVAVEVLLHPKSDLQMLLPNGKYTMVGEGLAVISINIPLLALQWRCFNQAQAIRYAAGDGLLGVGHFIHMYVLPNMLGSHLDIAILNRMMNLFYGAPMGAALIRHAFPVVDYSRRVDNVLNDAIDMIQKKSLRYRWMLQNIPTAIYEDMQEVLLLPDWAPTRQIHWAVMLSRLNIMKFLVDLGGERSKQENRLELNTLQRELRYLKHDSVYESVLPKDLLYDTEETITSLMTA